MKAEKLYAELEKDFILPGLSDDWAEYMKTVSEFITENFKRRSMGLVCDNTNEIKKVYTAVFPSNAVMQYILNKNERDVLLFVHHPSTWDIRKAPEVFQQMDRNMLQEFKKSKISVYNLHVPLDNYGKYSTSATLAKAVGIKPEKPFAPYFGGLCGIFGKSDSITVQELKKKFESAIEHKANLYKYSGNEIENGNVAVIAGGGNAVEMLEEIAESGVNVLVTGITARNDHSQKAHDYAKEHNINILGGTHYSTEKFACIAMCKYFENLGLPSKFIEDKPVMEDI